MAPTQARRRATCRCEALSIECRGDPVRVSVCHCLECQKRSGSAFAVQARFPADRTTVTGLSSIWSQTGASGQETRYHFCPACGSTLFYVGDAQPDLVAVAVGAFVDPDFPPPFVSVWEARKHPWVVVTGDVEHIE